MPDFDSALRDKLTALYKPIFTTEQVGEVREFAKGFGDENWRGAEAAEDFASAVLARAYPLKVSLVNHRAFRLKKGDVRAECAALLNTLGLVQQKLRAASIDLRRAVALDDEFYNLADHVLVIENSLRDGAPRLNESPDRSSEKVFGNRIAMNLIAHLIAVHAEYGLQVRRGKRASLPQGFIKTLKLVGDAMSLVRSEKTWRNLVSTSASSLLIPAN